MRSCSRRVFFVCIGVLMPCQIYAQSRWVIDSRSSLAWWQMNPHFGHLWATTCPADPSWQPGEGAELMKGHVAPVRTVLAQHDETRVPLYPRGEVQPVCQQSVTGELVVRDTVRWSGARGSFVVKANDLFNGQRMRDSYAKSFIYEVEKYPEIRFELDSVSNAVPGDTLQVKAYGTFEFRGVRKPIVMPVKANRDAFGLRVRGRFDMPAAELINHFKVSKWYLGLGVGQRLWETAHVGIDVILRQEK